MGLIRRTNIEKMPVNQIEVRNRWRQPGAKQIKAMRESLRENGLLTTIAVRLIHEQPDGEPARLVRVLVYGATRLAAAKQEGWVEIDAQIFEGSDVDSEKAELVENLHRNELSKLQHDRQIARYIALCGRKEVLRGPRAKPRAGRPAGGVRAAARELGLPESTARDAAKAGNIAEPAVAIISELGLADDPTAYRAIAAEPTVEAQVAKAHEIAGKKPLGGLSPVIKARSSQVNGLMAAWKDARSAARREFLMKIGHANCHVTGSATAAGTSRRTPKIESASGVAVRDRKALRQEGQLELDWTKGIRLNGDG